MKDGRYYIQNSPHQSLSIDLVRREQLQFQIATYLSPRGPSFPATFVPYFTFKSWNKRAITDLYVDAFSTPLHVAGPMGLGIPEPNF